MKILILCDKDIKRYDSEKVDIEFSSFMQTHAGITPNYTYKTYDFSTYPKVKDADGDEHLTETYLRDTIGAVYKEYGETIDHVILQIHRDNWSLAGIWGTNYSNIYNGYQVHVNRFDHRNLANSFGTRYHEMMHSFDALILVYTKFLVADLFKVSWDKYVVHGGRPDKEGTTEWKYIRWKDNAKALEMIAPKLSEAYKARHELNRQHTLIAVLKKLIIAYKQLKNQKSTVNK